MKSIVQTGAAPAAIGPYSQAIRVANLLFVSGQLPIDPATGSFAADDIAGQAEQALTNLQAIVEAGGATLRDVVKVTVYLANIDDFAAMNDIYAHYFSEEPPARAAFEVAALPKGALIEIEAIAAVQNRDR